MTRLPSEELRAEFLLSLITGDAINGFIHQALGVAREFESKPVRTKVLAATSRSISAARNSKASR